MRIHKDQINILHRTPFIEVVMTPYTDNEKNNKIWYWVRRIQNKQAVVIVAIYNNKFVITKEFRVPLDDYEWGFPAGLIDKNETPEQVAQRELKEETGLDIDKILHISPPIYNSAGLTNETIIMVICSAKGQISQDLTEASEDITTFLYSYEELPSLLQDTTKKFGAKAYLYLLMSLFTMEQNNVRKY